MTALLPVRPSRLPIMNECSVWSKLISFHSSFQSNRSSSSGLTPEEAAVIRRFQDGDEDALANLIAQHKEPLHRFIFRQVLDEHETADILSQTFIRAYRNRAHYEPRAKFRTWLYTIAGNLCRDHLRLRRRRPADFTQHSDSDSHYTVTNADLVGDTSLRPDQASASHEELEIVMHSISRLPQKLRTPLILCCLESVSHAEAAEILNCTVKAIETRIYRAKQTLRKRLSGML